MQVESNGVLDQLIRCRTSSVFVCMAFVCMAEQVIRSLFSGFSQCSGVG